MKKSILVLSILSLTSIHVVAQTTNPLLESNPGNVTRLKPLLVDPSLLKTDTPLPVSTNEELMRDLNMSNQKNSKLIYRSPTVKESNNKESLVQPPPNLQNN